MEKKQKIKKITPIEEAILCLADYLENPNHDEYKVREHIMWILGIEKKFKKDI